MSLLNRAEFPLSNQYDEEWVLENQMGPNALWLIEWLSQAMELKPGMRVLDLGCGRGITSIFLAREFGVRVWALDLWIGPDNNWERAVAAEVADNVCPMRCEAHALPFAHGFFDAVVSIDAYTYFGTDNLYLGYLAGFVRPGGKIGIVVPGLTEEIDQVPAHLAEPQSHGAPFWEDEHWCFHSPQWWKKHWSKVNLVGDVHTELMPDGWRLWRDFEVAVASANKSPFPSAAEGLDKDAGRTLGLVRATATRLEGDGMDLYDPSIGVRLGVDT